MKYYKAPQFGNAFISHGFFGRDGGVSDGLYESLNAGLGSGDDTEKVKENRRRIAEEIGAREVAALYQIHSDVCVYAEAAFDERPQADASVTDTAGVALLILTADCAPVLFSAQKEDGSPIIAAAHAGWGGAFKGVLQRTVDVLCEKGAVQDSIQAVIGPCIQQKSYEVDEAFFQKFIDQSPENEIFFKAGERAGHPHFDLSGYCAKSLSDRGVKAVSISGIDTYPIENGYFSHRRATHNEQLDCGRQASVIMIR